MPVFLKHKDNSIEYEIWHIKEEYDKLITLLDCKVKDQIEAFKLDKRKKEFLCSRIILKHLFNRCVTVRYDEFGKGHVEDTDWHISISHSGEFVAVARSRNKVGIDIERISEKLNRTKHKFSSTRELSNIDFNNNLYHLALHWSAKESVYKIVGNENLIFDTEIQIEKFVPKQDGEFVLELVCKQYNQKILIKYEKINDYVLTFCTLK